MSIIMDFKYVKTGCLIIFLLYGVWAWSLSTPGQLIFKTTQPIMVKDGKTGLNAFDTFLSQKA
jgi:hypothetical protein